jgi:hypothetical protein
MLCMYTRMCECCACILGCANVCAVHYHNAVAVQQLLQYIGTVTLVHWRGTVAFQYISTVFVAGQYVGTALLQSSSTLALVPVQMSPAVHWAVLLQYSSTLARHCCSQWYTGSVLLQFSSTMALY